MNIVQIGTCVANDDLTTIIGKKQPNKLILIEPLSIHNNEIKKCYDWVNNLHIENIAITSKTEDNLKFYYHKENGPEYVLASTSIEHILKHNYRIDGIIEISVKTMTINDLFDKYNLIDIDILYIDSEGLDDQIIKSINFDKYNIENIYFENLHLTQNDIYNYMENIGYSIKKNVGENGWSNLAKKNKLKLVHILNSLDGERETKSINSLSELKNYGVSYIQQLTPLYEGDNWYLVPPLTNYPHNKGHYGLYESFKKAIKDNFTDDIDALIICECDCILDIPYDCFQYEMEKTLNFCNKNNIYQFSWGGIFVDNIQQGEVYKVDDVYPNYCIVNKIIMAHFTILTKQSRNFYLSKIDNIGWDSADIWLNELIYSEFVDPGKQATVFNRLAYQCEGMSLLENTNRGEIKKYEKNMKSFDNFNWGVATDIDIRAIGEETMGGIYEKFFKVEEHDVVVDIGSFVGSFTYSILDRNPEHCWVIEPVEAHFRILYKNLKSNPVSFIRGAISDEEEINIIWSGHESKSPGINFKKFITNNCIDKIDFLKTDCEGGEYLIFTEENFDYIKNNVKKIAGEWHLNGFREKFRYFRDNILIKFDNYNVFSVDGVDIKWDLFNEHFIEYYNQIIIYIDNRK